MKLVLVASIIFAGCAPLTVPAQKPDPNIVEVLARPATFYPEHVQIPIGKTVLWKNAANVPHTITPDDPTKPGTWKTARVVEAGDFFAHTFTTAGTYSYNCAIHAGMIGTIHVR